MRAEISALLLFFIAGLIEFNVKKGRKGRKGRSTKSFTIKTNQKQIIDSSHPKFH